MRLISLIILSLTSVFHHVLADQVFTAHVGGTFGHNFREPKYDIQFHTEDSPYHPDDDQETLVMPNKDGQKFLCYLPKVEKSKNGRSTPQQNMSSMVMESEKQVKLKTPDELLEVLKDRCFLRQEGWWSYEFCYQKQLRQFHLEDEKVAQEFVLGVYNEEATVAFNQNLSDVSTLKDPRAKDAAQRYHAHQYMNGTECDLTNQPRETEVPTLCKHPLFQEEKPMKHTINCNVFHNNYKESKVQADDKFEDRKIAMVADIEDSSNDDTEE